MAGDEGSLVRSGYNLIADTYVQQRDQFGTLPFLESFVARLPVRGAVLDVGCGGGIPIDRFLIDRGFRVHGLDMSDRMIEIATSSVPSATFEVGDMLDLVDGQFAVDGIVSFYAIFHICRARHQEVLHRFATFLPQGGALLISMGASEWEGAEDFHGERMIWSHYGAERNALIVETAGFELVLNEIDRSGGEEHQIIMAVRR